MQKCNFNKVVWQKFLHISASLGLSTSLDGIKIKGGRLNGELRFMTSYLGFLTVTPLNYPNYIENQI